MSKLFFALWPNDAIRTQCNDIAKQFNQDGIRRVTRSNLHITLVFLGEISEQDKVGLIGKVDQLQNKPFNIELTQIGWWQKSQILWIGTAQIPMPLLALVSSINKCVKQQGLKMTRSEYKPHVTLAREVKQILIPNNTVHILWQVDHFTLLSSNLTDTGIVYHVIKRWVLSG